jgi:hypothetical protein
MSATGVIFGALIAALATAFASLLVRLARLFLSGGHWFFEDSLSPARRKKALWTSPRTNSP